MVSNQILGQEISQHVLGISGLMGLYLCLKINWRRDEHLLEKVFRTVFQSAPHDSNDSFTQRFSDSQNQPPESFRVAENTHESVN